MTVKELIEKLKKYDENAQVKATTTDESHREIYGRTIGVKDVFEHTVWIVFEYNKER